MEAQGNEKGNEVLTDNWITGHRSDTTLILFIARHQNVALCTPARTPN